MRKQVYQEIFRATPDTSNYHRDYHRVFFDIERFMQKMKANNIKAMIDKHGYCIIFLDVVSRDIPEIRKFSMVKAIRLENEDLYIKKDYTKNAKISLILAAILLIIFFYTGETTLCVGWVR